VGSARCAAFWGHDGKALAAFYAAALGWEVTQAFGDSAAMISDGTTKYVFYTAESFKASDWPEDELVFHLDLTSATSRPPRAASSPSVPPQACPPAWRQVLDRAARPLRLALLHQRRRQRRVKYVPVCPAHAVVVRGAGQGSACAGKAALAAGASSGGARAIATELGRAGATVYVI
jgi:hypothetical protein